MIDTKILHQLPVAAAVDFSAFQQTVAADASQATSNVQRSNTDTSDFHAILQSTHEDRDHVHIVMEVCQGGELFDSIVSAGNFTERKAAAVFRKMVDVIHHCHELGVMHRCAVSISA